MTLEEALSEKYAIIAQHPFKQRLVTGEVSVLDYLNYIVQLQPLLNHMERITPPHLNLKSDEQATVDVTELRNLPETIRENWVCPIQTTFHYMQYLLRLSEENITPHMYITYMFLLTEGQDIKSKIHGGGRVYKFDNINECIESLTSLKKDEWVDEANIALDYYIAIFDELEEISEVRNLK
jgi:heme oxygenase